MKIAFIRVSSHLQLFTPELYPQLYACGEEQYATNEAICLQRGDGQMPRSHNCSQHVMGWRRQVRNKRRLSCRWWNVSLVHCLVVLLMCCLSPMVSLTPPSCIAAWDAAWATVTCTAFRARGFKHQRLAYPNLLRTRFVLFAPCYVVRLVYVPQMMLVLREYHNLFLHLVLLMSM